MRKLILASLVCIGVVSVGNAYIDIYWCDGRNEHGVSPTDVGSAPCGREAFEHDSVLSDCSRTGDPKDCNKVMAARLKLEDCRRQRCER